MKIAEVVMMAVVCSCLCVSGLVSGDKDSKPDYDDWTGDYEIVNYGVMTNKIRHTTNSVEECITLWYTNVSYATKTYGTLETELDYRFSFSDMSSNTVEMTFSNGTFCVEYNCPVTEAAKAFLDALEGISTHTGYVVLTREEYEKLKGDE